MASLSLTCTKLTKLNSLTCIASTAGCSGIQPCCLDPSSMLLHKVKAGSTSFASAMQAYARKLGQCLLDLATSTDTSTAEAEMQSCTMETHALNLCVAIGNPISFSKFHSQRLDGLSGADSSHLSDTFYVEMLVWCSVKTASCAEASAYIVYMHHNPSGFTSMLSMPSSPVCASSIISCHKMHCMACRNKRSRCSICPFAKSPRHC